MVKLDQVVEQVKTSIKCIITYVLSLFVLTISVSKWRRFQIFKKIFSFLFRYLTLKIWTSDILKQIFVLRYINYLLLLLLFKPNFSVSFQIISKVLWIVLKYIQTDRRQTKRDRTYVILYFTFAFTYCTTW